MSNGELLLAFSDLMDKKLDERDKRWEERLDQKLDERDKRWEEHLEQKLDERDKRWDEKLDCRLQPLEDRLSKVEEVVKRVALTQENVIIPRLDTITDCYLDTFKRYAKATEEFETMKQDIIVLKRTVESHSEQLNRLAMA